MSNFYIKKRVYIISLIVILFFQFIFYNTSLGSSKIESTNVSEAIFVPVDRALGENADDEPLRACTTRLALEMLDKAKASKTEAENNSIDYDTLLNWAQLPENRDRFQDNGILNRGSIPQQFLRFCQENNIRPHLTVGDLDGDGLPEVAYTINRGQKVMLFWNQGLGRFLPQQLTELCCNFSGLLSFVDVDADGDADVVHLNAENQTIRTLLNEGGRKFSPPIDADRNMFEQLGGGDYLTVTSGDLNRDGLSDLIINSRYIGRQAEIAREEGKPLRPIRIFYNTGKAPFWQERTFEALPEIDPTPATLRRNATTTELTRDMSGTFNSTIADFNNDGWLDIYVASDYITPRLFIAESGGERFIDKTVESGVLDGIQNTMGSAAIDWNHDGWMDIIATDTDRKLGECFGNRACTGVGGHRLLQNNRDLTFTDIGYKIGIADAGWGFGFTLTDLNLDGFGDFLVATGDLPVSRNESIWNTVFDKPYLLLRNKDGFTDGSLNLLRALRSPGPQPVVVSADFDGDLRPDLLFNGFENHAPYLLLNRSKGKAASVQIVGAGLGATPTGGEGAKITLSISDRPDQVYLLPSFLANYSAAVGPTPLPLGLGDTGKAVIKVEFISGDVQSYKILSGRSYTIKERLNGN